MTTAEPSTTNPGPAPLASVVISTKSRKDELRHALKSCVAQDGFSTGEIEVLVIDDGSTDGTADVVRSEFPDVRLVRFEQSEGLIVQRNRGVELARAPIAIIIDDDALFSTPNVVRGIVADFDHARVGALAVPMHDMCYPDTSLKQRAPDDHDVLWMAHFKGTAQALRRSVFQRVGGFRASLVHQCEEMDYCLRMLAAGYVVRAGRGDPIHHFESVRRDKTRQMRFNARNHILGLWHNVPMPMFLWRLPAVVAQIIVFGIRLGYIKATAHGFWQAFKGIVSGKEPRRPVTADQFRLFRHLWKAAPMRLAELPLVSFPPGQPLDVAAPSIASHSPTTAKAEP